MTAPDRPSLAHGRSVLAIPGPSIMPDRVLNAMHRAAPNIYTGELHDLTRSLIPDLKAVARTAGHAAIYIGNGHAAWEASLANVLGAGDKALVLATGRVGLGWGEQAARLGVEVEVIDFGKQSPIDPARAEAALRADTEGRIKAVLIVQVDTSSSAKSDVAAIRAAMDAAGHDALLMVDCIASLGCDVFEMDAWGADVMVAGCQKGLMTPPGLGFVFFNDKADAVRAAMPAVSSYWDWVPRTRPTEYYQYFCGTAPTHHLYGLRTALDMILHEEGLENVWARHEILARALWAAVETWSVPGGIALNMADPATRGHSVTALRLPSPKATELRTWAEREAGVTLGIGLGMAPPGSEASHGFFRIGHMGHINAHGLMGVLGVIEAGLRALDIPHEAGGLSAAAAVLAGR
jgi:alanine-glyoxylate transaminase/serine-glyoxylate transaminase/serine-pyruvate transaminase